MDTVNNFAEYGLSQDLINSLNAGGFEKASAIQDMTITPILEGKDIFAQAETGSGKTGSFAIPVLEKLIRNNQTGEIANKKSLYVVLSPTRELAQQTYKVFEKFGASLNVKSTCIIGGEDIEKQKKRLETGSHILVATPGRLKDLLGQSAIEVDLCEGVVFDEADRLFDMGFQKDIEYILSSMSDKRQLIMVSATSNMEVMHTAYKFKSTPTELKLNEDSLLVDHIDHQLAMISKEEKMPLLVNLLRGKEDAYAVVFCNTQFQTHSVAEWLKAMGFKAKPISGRMAQNKRTKLMQEFRDKEVTILVCTDVAARGLDIKDVNFVVNFDLPSEAANYVHRIGRTGRAGKAGQAISFCAYEDCENLDDIYEFIDAKIPKMDLEDDHFATDLCKKPYIDSKTLKVVERQARPERTKRKSEHKSKQQRPERKKRDNSEVVANRPKVDRKNFEITSYDFKDSRTKAAAFFNLKDTSLLGFKKLEEGRKKFFIFGPRLTKYRFYIKPIYKKILVPYIVGLIKRAKLNLNVRVSYKKPYLRISFSGKDEKLLSRNNNEMLEAFDHIIRKHLSTRIELPKDLKFSFKCYNDSKKQEKQLIDLVEKTKSKVIETNSPILLKALSPVDRRIVHQHLDKDPKVKTTSIGDGRFKKIEISLR